MLRNIFILVALLLNFNTFSDNSIPDVTVATSLQSFDHEGQTIYAFSLRHAPHWHTYWKNPGDAGLPTELTPNNAQFEEFSWPVPTRYIEKGDILAYGYSGTITRFFKVTKNDDPSTLNFKAVWLVCKHICIPGKIDVTSSLEANGKIQSTNADKFNLSQQELKESFKDLPQKKAWPKELDIVLKAQGEENELVLYTSYDKAVDSINSQLGLLTPYRQTLLDIRREELYQAGSGNLFSKIKITWDGEYHDPQVPFPEDGQFKEPITLEFLYQNPKNKQFSIIKKEFTSFDTGSIEVNETLLSNMKFLAPPTLADKDSNSPSERNKDKVINTTGPADSNSFIFYLLFAFLGGLILNIMPCVLPVISLKLFGLVSHSEESNSRIFKHNLFYTLGVLSTFLVLSLTVIGLKTAGHNVGWGFQLQSPIFVCLMIIVLFVFTLNLFSLFEFRTPGGKSLGQVQLKSGFSGDFASGVLATILSTPCSAPFLGTALTFAFTSNNITIISIFLAIGLGLASPFIITGLFPRLIRHLPKPGMWMENVKKFLGLTLLITLVWLLDVYQNLTSSPQSLMHLSLILIFTFFAFYFQKSISKKTMWRSIFFIIPLLLTINIIKMNVTAEAGITKTGNSLVNEKNVHSDIIWEPWSEQKMKDYANASEVLFIDFTARWCITCKVNEKLVLDTSGFNKLVKDKNIKLLLADWTKHDPVIGEFLNRHGYVGVPAYFIQQADGTLINLGETISLTKIEKYLN